MKYKSLFFFTLVILSICLYGQDLKKYYPKSSGEVISHQYYTLDYIESHEQANWVIYFAKNYGQTKRSDNFRSDPEVTTHSASLEDYAGSGYDRGHLAPAADMNSNKTSMSESFYMSNMSPQKPGFNRGIWKNLEELVRIWGINNESATDMVITGPVLTKSCGKIGEDVTVPCAYYKIYCDPEANLAIGFLLPNEPSQQPFQSYVVSIDEIETITGIDFFYQLDDVKENRLEALKDIDMWDWKPSISEKKPLPLPPSQSKTCLGKTASGKRCSRSAGTSGYCWQHEKH